MMREVFGKILRKKIDKYFLSYCPFLIFKTLQMRKVLVFEARNFYQLIEYNE